MNDPIRNAKPVGPPPPGSPPAAGSPPPPSRGAGEPDVGAQGHGGQQAPPGQPRMNVYSWSSSGRRMPWLAILLVALGLGLLVELLIPELTFVSLILLAAGAAFAVAGIVGGVVGATVPALVLIAWALARMSGELSYLSGDGWSALFVGVALLIAWGLGRYQHVRREWALWLGVILGVIGLADASDTLPLDLDMAIVIPVAMIGVGIYLLLRRRLPRSSASSGPGGPAPRG